VASLAGLMLPDLMFGAEEQPAAVNAAVGLSATNVTQSPVDFLFAPRMITKCRYTVANITVPIGVESE
jgi:hypothetical protein